ncbi:MAG TPA: hypothetical protein DEQ87_10590 [Algoriphagus sp.]|nr:hypothetical protein [Algoriphagus sp.]MAN87583.1 hypothetical protein [Algoriphagus sp.]HAH38136.1 hypothetical protein [Algoriphagus sp.]HAS58004.1 hypothetical protein [Algoriphagus sp.]HAZ24997.1 hypothetical protein [Algoriphagus sp.]
MDIDNIIDFASDFIKSKGDHFPGLLKSFTIYYLMIINPPRDLKPLEGTKKSCLFGSRIFKNWSVGVNLTFRNCIQLG